MTNKAEAMILVREAQNPKYPGTRGRVPRYAAIHHNSPLGALWQPQSGDPHFMFTTAKYLAKTSGKVVRVHVQKFLRSGGSDEIGRWLRKFEKRTDTLNRDALKTPAELGRKGVDYARQIAPEDTGSLVQAISWRPLNGQK